MADHRLPKEGRCCDRRGIARAILQLPPVNPMKNRFAKILLLLLVSAGGFILGGCTYMEEGESNVPWSRPAEWENRLPGLGGR